MTNELQKIEREVHRDVEEIEEKIQTSETFLLSAIPSASAAYLFLIIITKPFC